MARAARQPVARDGARGRPKAKATAAERLARRESPVTPDLAHGQAAGFDSDEMVEYILSDLATSPDDSGEETGADGADGDFAEPDAGGNHAGAAAGEWGADILWTRLILVWTDLQTNMCMTDSDISKTRF